MRSVLEQGERVEVDHGGMLDRFDSTLMAVPAAVVYLYTLTLF